MNVIIVALATRANPGKIYYIYVDGAMMMMILELIEAVCES